MTRGTACLLTVCSALIVTGAVLSGCTAQTTTGVIAVAAAAPRKADAQARPSGKFANGINDFGIDLVQATSGDKGKNAIVSPVSAHAALAMTANGAEGETADQMRRVLRIEGAGFSESNEGWAALLGGLPSRSQSQTLEVANAIWARKGVDFKRDFLDADADYFGAQISMLDFATDDVVGAINRWASENTNGMIDSVVSRPPSAETIMYLANAVYFKGDWVSAFRRDATVPRPFTKADGTQVEVEMMNDSSARPYAENGALRATKLPYKGNDAAFYVMLPEEGVAIDTALESLEGTGFESLRKALDASGATKVSLGLPKLDSEFSASLADPLKDMGMPRAFDPRSAQFGGIATGTLEPIYIDDVLHMTKVKVDETGTEAAAVTVGSLAAKGVPEFKEIVCDRPYLFAIVDEPSGAILFLGVVNDPTN